MISNPFRSLLLAAAISTAATTTLPAGAVKVAGMNFTTPEAFQADEPSSFMRKAQLKVGEGKEAGEIVFFHFGAGGGGGVDANVKRWLAKFQEPQDQINAKTEKTKAGEVPVTIVSADGTLNVGPPRGPADYKPAHALLGAIVEGKEGAIFIRLTGPTKTVKAHTEAFKKMVTGAK